jgi:hypothetical protein
MEGQALNGIEGTPGWMHIGQIDNPAPEPTFASVLPSMNGVGAVAW